MIHAYPWLPTTACTHIHGYVTVTAAPAFKFCAEAFSHVRDYDGVVSKSILEKADIGAANVDWFCILPEKRIVDDLIFSWVAGFEKAVSTEFFDYEKENLGIEILRSI